MIEEIPRMRVVKHRIQMRRDSLFVREVLMPLFPRVFRRASAEHIQTIRNLLNSLNIFEGESQTSGPTCQNFMRALPQVSFEQYTHNFGIFCFISYFLFEKFEMKKNNKKKRNKRTVKQKKRKQKKTRSHVRFAQMILK